MLLVHTIEDIRQSVIKAKMEGKSVGLVPTMGALHEGHLSLIKAAKTSSDFVVVSVFVNPTQFLPSEDFSKYPRTLETDAAACEAGGVNVVFAPSASQMYPEGYDTWVEVGGITDILEGEIRPGHFRGVTTVCNKLFNLVQPDVAYFGRKDYQQLAVIRKMVRDLNMNLRVEAVETVREPDGLAMSSRNRYLTCQQRQAALALSKALSTARTAYEQGERESPAIVRQALEILGQESLLVPDHLEIVDAETLQRLSVIDRPAVVLVAASIGSVRLIDNIALGDS